jgi:hypothetical protein
MEDYTWISMAQTNQSGYKLEGMHTYLVNKTGQKETYTQTNSQKQD